MNDRGYNLRYCVLISLVGGFGGFLFGYDTAVVSGAIGFLRLHFHLTSDLTGWAASSLLVGCMAGVLAAGPLGDRWGRQRCLMLCAALFCLTSLGSALAPSFNAFIWSRFAGGAAIGAASMLSPLYIAEIAPEKIRGTLVALYQLAIVVGILVVFFINLEIQRFGSEEWNAAFGWRWMFASLLAPSGLFLACLGFVPESPRWLMQRGQKDRALAIMERIGGRGNAAREFQQIEAALGQESGRWQELFAPGYRRALGIGVLLAVFGQLSGINAIMYYAPEIFKATGSGRDAAFGETVTVGAVNLLFTFVAIWLVDRAGRRPLLLVGTALQVVTLLAVCAMAKFGGSPVLLLLSVLGYVAAFAIAMGPIPWIINAEIFPTKLRGRAMSLAILLLWVADWLVTQTFPRLLEGVGLAATFGAYAGCSLLSLVFIAKAVPETKGRTLEEIEGSWKRPSNS